MANNNNKDNLTEYGLIGALIAAGIMFVGSLLNNNNKPAADIPSASATSPPPPPPPTPIKAGCGCNAGK